MVDNTPVLDIKPYIPRYDQPGIDQKHEQPKEPDGVRIPDWITSDSLLSVAFDEHAVQQIEELHIDKVEKMSLCLSIIQLIIIFFSHFFSQTSIIEILKNDPRTVYSRKRYSSQIFTFRLGESTVTCKFNDEISTVTVMKVERNVYENISEDLI